MFHDGSLDNLRKNALRGTEAESGADEEPADPLAGRGHLRPGLRVGKDIMKIAWEQFIEDNF